MAIARAFTNLFSRNSVFVATVFSGEPLRLDRAGRTVTKLPLAHPSPSRPPRSSLAASVLAQSGLRGTALLRILAPAADSCPGAFVFGITFDTAASTWWNKHNRGKQWAEYVSHGRAWARARRSVNKGHTKAYLFALQHPPGRGVDRLEVGFGV